MIYLKRGETVIGHIRIDKEMESWPKGERLRQAILHKNLPHLTRMYAVKTETGIFRVSVSSFHHRAPDYLKEFSTFEQMNLFVREMGATLYSIREGEIKQPFEDGSI